jgi:hypothetical protein
MELMIASVVILIVDQDGIAIVPKMPNCRRFFACGATRRKLQKWGATFFP